MRMRLELLRLTKPEGINSPDMDAWIERAKRLEAWLNESAGQAATVAVDAAPDQRPVSETTKDRTRAKTPRHA